MRTTGAWTGLAVLAVALCAGGPACAGSLADALHGYINHSLTLVLQNAPDVADVVTPIVQREAVRGTDFPVTGTTPGVTYTFNVEAGTFERSEGSLGPIFAERADTVGRHQLALGASYLYAKLVDNNGQSFGPQITEAFKGRAPESNAAIKAGLFGRDFSLANNVVDLSATYGLTDRWDVNVLLPLVATRLEVRGVAVALVGGVGDLFPVQVADNAFGPGDLLLRTKFHFAKVHAVDLAAELALRLPTGREADFQGLGDTTVTPGLIASRTWGRYDVHASVGFELNADDLQRTRARYALGATLQPWARLGFPIDVIGSSSFVDDDFTIPTAGKIVPDVLPSEFVRSIGMNDVIARVSRSDVVDIAIGLRANPFGNAVVFLSAIVPLTNDGLRAAVIPAGGVEYTF
jgi:hypothetical protein